MKFSALHPTLSSLPTSSARAAGALAAGFLVASLGAAGPALGQQTADIVAFGDSLTRGFGDGGVSCNGGPSGGYPPRLSDRLEDQGYPNTMRTSAVCGELTSQAVSRLPGVLSANPETEVVIVMEGTNDLSDRDISTESMRFNIERMSEIVLDRDMRPVIAAPPPRAPEAGSNSRTGFLTSLIRGDAEVNEVDFANTYDGLLAVPDLYDRFYADPFHPNGSGYGIVANILRDPTISAITRSIEPPEPCMPGTENLCLAAERFRVEVDWDDNEGETGRGQAVPLTADTGFFWFFEETNIELVVKVLDAREINGHFWVFYGALSDVEYTITVTDTEVGTIKTYDNAQGNLASRGDTLAFRVPLDGTESPASMAGVGSDLGARFGDAMRVDPEAFPASADPASQPDGAGSPGPARWVSRAVPLRFGEASAETVKRLGRDADPVLGPGRAGLLAAAVEGPLAGRAARKEDCATDGPVLCLTDSRFALEVSWRDADGLEGVGTAKEVTSDTGYFWFFSETNVELVVKVLDAREINGNFWVFYGALSDVEYTLTIVDTETDQRVSYSNPLGTFGSRSDIEAFQVP